jgi:hypothetical protein
VYKYLARYSVKPPPSLTGSSKVKVSYITTDSQPASPSWCQAPIWDQFFFPLEIFFRQLRVCYFVSPSLMRGRVCNLLLLLVSPAQSRSGLSPAWLKTIFYCLNAWDSPNLEGQVPVFIHPRNRVAQIYPRTLGSLSVASYDSQVEVFYPASIREYLGRVGNSLYMSSPLSWKYLPIHSSWLSLMSIVETASYITNQANLDPMCQKQTYSKKTNILLIFLSLVVHRKLAY